VPVVLFEADRREPEGKWVHPEMAVKPEW